MQSDEFSADEFTDESVLATGHSGYSSLTNHPTSPHQGPAEFRQFRFKMDPIKRHPIV